MITGPSRRNAARQSSKYEELGWTIASDEMVVEAGGEHELREKSGVEGLGGNTDVREAEGQREASSHF